MKEFFIVIFVIIAMMFMSKGIICEDSNLLLVAIICMLVAILNAIFIRD
jgi:hypothetical protein